MIYVISDLHGYPLNEFKDLLKKAKFSDNDFCFVLGDVIDRGKDGIELLKWLMFQPNMQLILGNHEAMMLSCGFVFDIVTDEFLDNLKDFELESLESWIENGAQPTLDALSKMNKESVLAIFEYLEDCPLYDQVTVNGRDFLLTHSGIENFIPGKPIEEYEPNDFLWNRPDITDKYFENITTIFGHTPTLGFGKCYDGEILITDTWIDIDIGAGYGRSPALLRLDDMKVFYGANLI